MSEKAFLKYKDITIELPILKGSEGELAIDIGKLRSQTGLITIDPGYKNTGSCTSNITFLNGERGILRYRGYNIEDIVSHASFLEVAYLIIFGELPKALELKNFYDDILKEATVDDTIGNILKEFPKEAHPMGVLSSLTNALISVNPGTREASSPEIIYISIVKLLAKFPILVGWIYCHKNNLDFTTFNKSISYEENIVNLIFGTQKSYKPNSTVTKTLNRLLILHADHEQNCSTSTVRIVGSSKAALFASISSGISALWGPLHGGANQAVIQMLEAINKDGGDIEKYLQKAKDKNDEFRLMGFGHRVYKNFDPRSKIIKKTADEVLKEFNVKDSVLSIAMSLEEVALNDDYFISRKLYPNVDFYSGIIYRALGIPTDMFTVMFALGRLPGWIGQWREMHLNNEPIGRPRQIYTGYSERKFVDIQNR